MTIDWRDYPGTLTPAERERVTQLHAATFQGAADRVRAQWGLLLGDVRLSAQDLHRAATSTDIIVFASYLCIWIVVVFMAAIV